MKRKRKLNNLKLFVIAFASIYSLFTSKVLTQDIPQTISGNFGLPGIIDLPTAKRLPDGELIVTQQLHKSLARTGISFQALPRVGFSFRYTGHGMDGGEAYGRINHDRSFDAHLSIWDETKYLPAISIGLRDFIGTGWYSSEYLVGTKSAGNFEVTFGLGFGRLAGKNAYSNPLKNLSQRFESRETNNFGKGGTLGTINWFQGDISNFFGFHYHLGNKVIISSEYMPDFMSKESQYLNIKSPWNFGASYRVNNYLNIATQYLHGSQVSVTAQINANPKRPPFKGGKDLAPVPMRVRPAIVSSILKNNEKTIRKVLAADKFEIHMLEFKGNAVEVDVTNTKFSSTSQAVGRVASTLQRFTTDTINVADISFYKHQLKVATYRVDLEKITKEQFNPNESFSDNQSIFPVDVKPISKLTVPNKFSWGVGPYVTHRLFNPDLPLSAELGLEIQSEYKITPFLNLSGTIRKSALTNLTDNKRRSNSMLPHVHSDWPLYDFAGQDGHIHELTLSYTKNLNRNLYGRLHTGLLEPFFAGIGGELLYKNPQSSFAFGIDVHHVRQRDYNMLLNLLDYEETVGHLSVYYDAGGMFEVEINAGRYLAGDWGATTTISRKFGTGWEVGGYATLTDVPFETFGEGSFDKAIYVSIPIDWIVSTPGRAKRRLTLRPITRDGGANLASARSLYRQIEDAQNSNFSRGYGRLWK